MKKGFVAVRDGSGANGTSFTAGKIPASSTARTWDRLISWQVLTLLSYRGSSFRDSVFKVVGKGLVIPTIAGCFTGVRQIIRNISRENKYCCIVETNLRNLYNHNILP